MGLVSHFLPITLEKSDVNVTQLSLVWVPVS